MAFFVLSMRLEVKFLFLIYLMMLVVIFVLPFYSNENYAILSNTTSQLRAQNTKNSWIMNMVFIGLGFGSVASGWRYYDGFSFHKILLLFFGGSLISCAFFDHAPIDSTISFSAVEDKIHSVLARITGFSFTFLSISTGFILRGISDKTIAFAIGALATLLSILMFNFESYMGLFQRLIFISSFGWLIYVFKKNLRH